MRTFRKLRILTLTILLLFTISGCKGGDDVIKIASIAPMTGQYAKMGEDISHGVILAVDEWNARGGVLGKQIELMIEDDRADPKDAVSVANKAAAYEIVGVVGHYNSSCTIPASNIYHENNIVMVTPASTNPMVTDREFPGIFRTCGRDDQQGLVEADFAWNVLKSRKIAIIHDKTTYGQGLADEFRKNLPDSAEIVMYEGITVGDKDFSAVITKARSKDPDLIMFGGLYAEAGLVKKQMRNLKLDCAFIAGDGVFDPEYIRIAGKAAEGTYITYAASPDNIPTAQKFLAAFKARWPEIGPFSIFAYDATNVILKGIEMAGTTDGVKIAEIIHANSFDGAIGTITFDHKGDSVTSPYILWTVQDGKLAEVDSELTPN